MSGQVHVGECPVMTFTSQLDGLAVVNQPWERFMVIDGSFLQFGSLWFQYRGKTLLFSVENGWAEYRLVGVPDEDDRTVWELVESEWAAPTAAAEGDGE